MKQTAVEWLIERFETYFEKKVYIEKPDLIKMLEQAKEMEKQQMRSASCSYIGGWEDEEFEYWYNETFKK
jgi:hypothetical protein